MLTFEDKLFLSNLVGYAIAYFAGMVIALYLLYFAWSLIIELSKSFSDFLAKKFPIANKFKIIKK